MGIPESTGTPQQRRAEFGGTRPAADAIRLELGGFDSALLELGRVSAKLDFLIAEVRRLHWEVRREGHMATAQFEAIKAEIERNTTVDASIMALVDGLAAQIQALKDDPAALQALADQLRGSSDSVVEKVKANTPAA